MELKVLKHERKKKSYFVNHKALVEITNLGEKNIKDDMQEIIWKASEKVGYNPSVYGLYGGKISKSARDNQYILVWETGASS